MAGIEIVANIVRGLIPTTPCVLVMSTSAGPVGSVFMINGHFYYY